MDIAYKRVLLKLSGEALAGSNKTGINKSPLLSVTNVSLPLHSK